MPCATKLLACGIKSAALESTGHYGITTYARARGCGHRSLRLARPPASLFPSASSLVNARHLKGVPGKKTDVQDAQWLQQLHAAGLLRQSFRPAKLRYGMRHRAEMIAEGARQGQLRQKVLPEPSGAR